jgi:hypothetical protein
MLARTVLALSLVIRVYDNTGVPAADMHAALAAAEAILRDAGIAVTWRQCPCENSDGEQIEPVGPAELIVRVAEAPPAGFPGSLGFSIVDVERRSGTLATIFADRVNALSALAGTQSGPLLGRAIAHEIGHLLLGTTRHADRGLMRGLWTTIDLQKDQPWDWALSAEDGARMRRALAARLRRPEQPAGIVARK